MNVGDAKASALAPLARYLAINMRPAGQRMFKSLQHDQPGAFAQHEAVAIAGRTVATPWPVVVVGGFNAVSRLSPVTPNV